MRSQTVIWLISIVVVGALLLGLSQCGYNKLRTVQSLESKSAEIAQEFPDVEHISTGTLATLIEADKKGAVPLLLIDSRAPEEFAISHISGAVNLETAEDVADYLKKVAPAPNAVAVYCSVGYRSAVVVDELNRSGIKNAKNVSGSIFAWANEDRPMVGPDGKPAEKVHPFNDFWGRLVKEERRHNLESAGE